jgi:hypothetical protein
MIKIRSEMAEFKQDIEFAKKQLEKLHGYERANKRVSIRRMIMDALKHKRFLAKKIDEVRYA